MQSVRCAIEGTCDAGSAIALIIGVVAVALIFVVLFLQRLRDR